MPSVMATKMEAVPDDAAGPTGFRVSGEPPFPFPEPTSSGLPADIVPRQATLRDRQTVATIMPFASRHQVPHSLLVYLCDQLNKEIEGGDTYPMMDTLATHSFASYWFQSFGAVMLLGSVDRAEDVVDGKDWAKECLGSFYIKPNYPGRSSHVCNAGFLVTDASRNRGVGRLMGEAYIDWAPRLGYTYSIFNLVYETNVASCRIWDALGFKRIGRVKGCGNLRSYPDRLIDAIIYGRDLAPGESEELVSEERFDKIKFYLKYGKYPNGADRAEKSRLRSAATHYKLLDGDKLMLKDKEVIADPGHQFEIARNVHVTQHGGINKTTATIAEKYHWSRIKETVSDVIRNCMECKELGKTPNPGGIKKGTTTATPSAPMNRDQPSTAISAAGRALNFPTQSMMSTLSHQSSSPSPGPYANLSDITVMSPSQTLQNSAADQDLGGHHHHHHPHHNPMLQDQPSHHAASGYQPIDPQIINQPQESQHDNPFEHYQSHADFQALLNATEEEVHAHQETDTVDRDLEMLIEHQDDDDEDAAMEGLEDDIQRERRGEQKGREMYDVGFDGPGT